MAADAGVVDDNSVAGLIANTAEFSTLNAALAKTNWLNRLASNSQGPYTVFAPTNNAFAKLPQATMDGLLADKDALEKVLSRHVVIGTSLQGKDIPPGSTPLTTANQEEVSATRNSQYIELTSPAGQAFITRFDMLANNGVIHAIDTPI